MSEEETTDPGYRGQGRQDGSGRGNKGGSRPGPGGNCLCPNCGATIPHQRGAPCYGQQCPQCGRAMTRE